MNAYRYENIEIGHEESFAAALTEEKMRAFLAITGDENPLHTDAAYAKSKRYAGKVAYGMLTASFLSTLAGMYLPGKYALIHSVEIKFVKAVYPSDKTVLTVKGVVTEKHDLFRQLTVKFGVWNEDGDKVCRGMMKVGVMD